MLEFGAIYVETVKVKPELNRFIRVQQWWCQRWDRQWWWWWWWCQRPL